MLELYQQCAPCRCPNERLLSCCQGECLVAADGPDCSDPYAILEVMPVPLENHSGSSLYLSRVGLLITTRSSEPETHRDCDSMGRKGQEEKPSPVSGVIGKTPRNAI